MFTKIIFAILFIGIGAILVYLTKFLLNIFLPKLANEKGILITKLIGLIFVVIGALIIFFSEINQYR